eukprot:ctg_110.g58
MAAGTPARPRALDGALSTGATPPSTLMSAVASKHRRQHGRHAAAANAQRLATAGGARGGADAEAGGAVGAVLDGAGCAPQRLAVDAGHAAAGVCHHPVRRIAIVCAAFFLECPERQGRAQVSQLSAGVCERAGARPAAAHPVRVGEAAHGAAVAPVSHRAAAGRLLRRQALLRDRQPHRHGVIGRWWRRRGHGGCHPAHPGQCGSAHQRGHPLVHRQGHGFRVHGGGGLFRPAVVQRHSVPHPIAAVLHPGGVRHPRHQHHAVDWARSGATQHAAAASRGRLSVLVGAGARERRIDCVLQWRGAGESGGHPALPWRLRQHARAAGTAAECAVRHHLVSLLDPGGAGRGGERALFQRSDSAGRAESGVLQLQPRAERPVAGGARVRQLVGVCGGGESAARFSSHPGAYWCGHHAQRQRRAGAGQVVGVYAQRAATVGEPTRPANIQRHAGAGGGRERHRQVVHHSRHRRAVEARQRRSVPARQPGTHALHFTTAVSGVGHATPEPLLPAPRPRLATRERRDGARGAAQSEPAGLARPPRRFGCGVRFRRHPVAWRAAAAGIRAPAAATETHRAGHSGRVHQRPRRGQRAPHVPPAQGDERDGAERGQPPHAAAAPRAGVSTDARRHLAGGGSRPGARLRARSGGIRAWEMSR